MTPAAPIPSTTFLPLASKLHHASTPSQPGDDKKKEIKKKGLNFLNRYCSVRWGCNNTRIELVVVLAVTCGSSCWMQVHSLEKSRHFMCACLRYPTRWRNVSIEFSVGKHFCAPSRQLQPSYNVATNATQCKALHRVDGWHTCDNAYHVQGINLNIEETERGYKRNKACSPPPPLLLPIPQPLHYAETHASDRQTPTVRQAPRNAFA